MWAAGYQVRGIAVSPRGHWKREKSFVWGTSSGCWLGASCLPGSSNWWLMWLLPHLQEENSSPVLDFFFFFFFCVRSCGEEQKQSQETWVLPSPRCKAMALLLLCVPMQGGRSWVGLRLVASVPGWHRPTTSVTKCTTLLGIAKKVRKQAGHKSWPCKKKDPQKKKNR